MLSLKKKVSLTLIFILSIIFAVAWTFYEEFMSFLHLINDSAMIYSNSFKMESNHNNDNIKIQFNNMSKSILLNAIQEIEHSIYFDEIAKDPNYDNIYSTGISPHYYDGPFSLNKTCKLMRFRYLCRPYISNKYGYNKFSLLLHDEQETNVSISKSARNILSTLQKQYNLYNYNIYDKLINNIKNLNKIFGKSNMNVLIYGNSHIKQCLLGLLCIFLDIDRNSIISYTPVTIDCNNDITTAQTIFNFHNTFCLDSDIKKIKESNIRGGGNDLRLNEEFLDYLYQTQFVDKNICLCATDYLHVELINNVSIYYIFANGGPKSIHNQTVKMVETLKLNVASLNFDLIAFNVGNSPPLNMDIHHLDVLEKDLIELNHINKPIIFHRSWYELYHRYLIQNSGQQFIMDMNKIKALRTRFPYLIYISSYRRYKSLLPPYFNDGFFGHWKESKTYGHFCNPGAPDHYALALLHLIDVLTLL